MKSVIKISVIIFNVFLTLLICGIVGGMTYDLGYKMPIWLQIIMVIITISFPFFVLYSFLKTPKITVSNDRIISDSFQTTKEILIENIVEINPSQFLNKINNVGFHYTILANDTTSINIPYKTYKNEKELIQKIEENIKKIPLEKLQLKELSIRSNKQTP